MYLQYRGIKLIECSGRSDEDNKAILNGDYVDKSPTITETGERIPTKIPAKEELIKCIFSDWQVGDILVIADSPLKYPKVQGDTLAEMTLYEAYQNGLYELKYNEVIYKDNVLTLEAGQYVDEKGVLQTVPKIEGTRVEWNWKTREWEEKATMLEMIQSQYAEYEGMDTVSTVREMEKIDPAMADEFVNMLIELRQMAYSLNGTVETQTVGYSALPIPKPSKNLQEYLDMRKIIKIGKNN